MIKKIITLMQKDEKEQTFEAVDSYVSGSFYRIHLSHERTVEIPTETILRIKTREVWIKPKKCCDHTNKKRSKR